MGIFSSKQPVVSTTVACTVPRSKLLGIHLVALDDSGHKQCAEVRSDISSFAPLGVLESVKTKPELGAITYAYTYTWPLPRDETMATALSGIWRYTTTRRVVTQKDDTGGGFVYTAVGGRRIVPLRQMAYGITGWYPAPIETDLVYADVQQFRWSDVRNTLEKTLTREKWDAWRGREATSIDLGPVPHRKRIVFRKWENTVGAIILHYQAVMHEAICILSQQCREGREGREGLEVYADADVPPVARVAQKAQNAVRQKGPEKATRGPVSLGPSRTGW